MRYLLALIVFMNCMSMGIMDSNRLEIPQEDIFDESTWDPQHLPCGCSPILPGDSEVYYYYEELPELSFPLYILFVTAGAVLRPCFELFDEYYNNNL